MARTFRCNIVTPSDSLFDAEASYVSFPAWDGQQGVMAGQSPILSRLGIGPMRVDLAEGGRRDFWVAGGFAQVQANVLTILTERAAEPADLAAVEAEQELREANAQAVSGSGHTPDDRQAAEAAQARARTKLAMARAAR